jgi:hypothetical protein
MLTQFHFYYLFKIYIDPIDFFYNIIFLETVMVINYFKTKFYWNGVGEKLIINC